MTNFQKVNEFKVGERVYGNFLIKQVKVGTTSANKPYMDVTIADKTGEVLAKIWDSTEEQSNTLSPNAVVYATGIVKEWDNKPQLTVEYIETLRVGSFDVKDFVKAAPISMKEMYKGILDYIKKIEDEEIRTLVGIIIDRYDEEFMTYPAARGMHHAVYSGLSYHTYTMLQVAEKLSEVYTFLNKDLLFAGVILHDVEKIHEMKATNGVVEDYTTRGKLLGHIIQSIILIENVGKEFGVSPQKVEVLQHLVASHHGKGEWGSPQPPKMAEAVMLHHIDNIDAKMYMVKDALDNAKENEEFTEKIRGLENNQLYIYKG